MYFQCSTSIICNKAYVYVNLNSYSLGCCIEFFMPIVSDTFLLYFHSYYIISLYLLNIETTLL